MRSLTSPLLRSSFRHQIHPSPPQIVTSELNSVVRLRFVPWTSLVGRNHNGTGWNRSDPIKPLYGHPGLQHGTGGNVDHPSESTHHFLTEFVNPGS
ncbi:hypothetical protein CEXT_416791 [Caerostris extrusa]|uniref:Uncharacterized protein n=1 Tax=Caerostris extrusa TaxID=172846 RepID=A0AAV4TKP8_CAEEX|nr:hypothetical protein CEXT_416791 [Caerostris extrusa]